MTKLQELLKSRKAWGAISALGLGLWGWASGDVSTEVIMGYVAVVVGFWQQAQARVDAAKITESTVVITE